MKEYFEVVDDGFIVLRIRAKFFHDDFEVSTVIVASKFVSYRMHT